jgi:hypothetical protein
MKRGVMSKQFTERSVMLSDMNAMHLAEFMIMEYPDNPHKWVKCIPFYGMYVLPISDPINSISPGMIMPDTSFLGYIVTVARASQKLPAPYKMYPIGASNYIELNLMPGMHAKDIATLTNFNLEMIRDFYKSFFVVNTDDEWSGWV